MVKSLSALAILLLLGASVVALPGFAPTVEAREAAVLAKGDRLEVRAAASNCATQIWPDLATSCLHGDAGVNIPEARAVSARR